MPESKFSSTFSIFDHHHRMERFGILFVSFVIILSILFGISFKIHYDSQKLNLGVQALYTKQSQWSLTGQMVKVVNIYRNDDSSKVFVLLKTGDDSASMSNLSTNAADYQMFMTGYNGDKLENNPKGSVYIFGNTGYMGLQFADASGFKAHMYDVVLRCNKDITSEIDQSGQQAYAEENDTSYKYHNQIHLYANFAGTDAVVADFLNKKDASTADVYAGTIASIQEEPVRTTLDTALSGINDDINLVNEYSARLKQLNVTVPALPVYIDGDTITETADDTKSNPTAFDKSMMNAASSIIDSDYHASNVTTDKGITGVEIQHTADNETTDDSGVATAEISTNLYYKTDFVFPGGCQYNYQTMTLTDNSLSKMMPKDMSYADWIEQKSVEKQTYKNITSSFDMSYYNKWYTSDGAEIDTGNTDTSSALDTDTSITSAITDYTSAVSKLYSDKYTYQTTTLYNLLKLQASTDMSTSLFSINADDSVLTMY